MSLRPQLLADIDARVNALATFVDGVDMCGACVNKMKEVYTLLSDAASCASKRLGEGLRPMIDAVYRDALSVMGQLAASDAIALQDDDREKVRGVVRETFETLAAAQAAADGCGWWEKALELGKDIGIVVRGTAETAAAAASPLALPLGALLLGAAALILVWKFA